MQKKAATSRDRGSSDVGFSLIELIISMAVFLAVSAMVLTFMFDMTRTQATVTNRTDMHASVRSVTEMMQQEISQAGRIAIPGGSNSTSISAAITANAGANQTIAVGSTSGMFDGMLLVISARGAAGTCPTATCDEETVGVTIPAAGSI